MKTSFLLPLLFFSSLVFSQAPFPNDITYKTTVEFQKSAAGIVLKKGSLTDIQLPALFLFDSGLAGKKVSFVNEAGQPIALTEATLGRGLFPNNADSRYKIAIDADSTVYPDGGEKINFSTFTLKIDNDSWDFNLKKVVPEKPKEEQPIANIPEEYAPGYIYYDVMRLMDKNVRKQDKIKILNTYKADNTNPFLREIIKETDAQIQGGGIGSLSFLSNIGNADVTYLAAGIARFLAERTKDELNEAFFKKMKEQMNAYPELTTAFPQTASFLNTIESYSYASMLQVLKESFESDIQNLPENLYKITALEANACVNIKKKTKEDECKKRMENLQAFFKEKREGAWLKVGLFTIKEGVQTNNPAELIKTISESDDLKSAKKIFKGNLASCYIDYDIASSLELGNAISQSLISKEEGRVWVTSSEFGTLFKNPKAIKIYFGLLLAREKLNETKIVFYKDAENTVSLEKMLTDIGEDILAKEAAGTTSEYQTQLIGLVKNTFSAYNAANNAVKKMAAAMDKSLEADPKALYDYYKNFSVALKTVANSELLKTLISKDIATKYNEIDGYITPSVDMAYHLATKKYSAAIFDAVVLLNHIPVFEKQPVAKSFIKYGTLISTVANAQSSDEVKKAIEASVLPVGSSSIKRNSSWTISLNAYVGGYWGMAHTKIRDSISGASKDTAYHTYGLYAPIGVSFSKGIKGCGCGFSLNAQLFDLGALVNFYLLKGDQTALPANFTVRLSNIFAPGAQLSFDLPKTPLSIMGGVQFVPALYKTSQIAEKSEILASTSWRGQLSLVVDIPMLNVKVWDFNRSKKR